MAHTIVELGLDPDDRFFDHVEKSALASALISRSTRRNSLNSASVQPLQSFVSHIAKSTLPTEAGYVKLQHMLLCSRFNFLFTMYGFQTLLAVLSVALSFAVRIYIIFGSLYFLLNSHVVTCLPVATPRLSKHKYTMKIKYSVLGTHDLY